MSNTTDSDKTARSRSPAYPLIPLGEAVDEVRKLWAAQRNKEARVDSALSALGYSSKNGTALRVIAALQQYGLLEGTGSGDNRKLRITEGAQDIINLPPEDVRHQTALRTAALAPTIYQLLWDRYERLLPDNSAIKPFLIRDRGFNDGIVDAVIKNYRETFEYAKLGKPEDPSVIEAKKRVEEERRKQPRGFFDGFFAPKFSPAASAAEVKKNDPVVEDEDQTLPILVGKGKVAKIPFPMTSADFDLLIGTLNLWKKKIVQDPPARTDHAARAMRDHFNEELEQALLISKPKMPLRFPAQAVWRNKDHDQPVTIIGSFGEKDGEVWFQSATNTGIRASELEFELKSL